jgi:hypothetical protein
MAEVSDIKWTTENPESPNGYATALSMFAPVELTIEIIRLRTPDRFVVNSKNRVTTILLF